MTPILPFLVSYGRLTAPYCRAYIPLGGGGGDTDNHDGSIGQDLLEVLVVLAFIQAVAQLLE